MKSLVVSFLLALSTVSYALSTASSDMNRKRILVTGANKGIGKAICARLLTEYHDTHVLLGSRSLERGQEAIQELVEQCGAQAASRLQLILVDTSSDESVQKAAKSIANEPKLYGIINNAGIMGRDGSFTAEEVINVNYFGVRRVNDYFGKLLLQRPGGRIVNTASAGGPNYVSRLSETDPSLYQKLARPWMITGGIPELDEIAKDNKHMLQGDSYGGSKALVNALTVLQAKLDSNKDIIINSVTPGWIMTDMTKNSGASGTVEKGAIPACWAMMDEDFIAKEPTGRYYGSDCVRSPLNVYRGPGEDPYVSDDDLVELSEAANAVSK